MALKCRSTLAARSSVEKSVRQATHSEALNRENFRWAAGLCTVVLRERFLFFLSTLMGLEYVGTYVPQSSICSPVQCRREQSCPRLSPSALGVEKGGPRIVLCFTRQLNPCTSLADVGVPWP